ncbi:hypothetical protein [Streptomyces sp. NPDC018610]|uniref:hypothetical protein n=1 Tax=Streptomyces sp. NPDC018610 TaxID=3365049 RepID=UPI00379F6E51
MHHASRTAPAPARAPTPAPAPRASALFTAVLLALLAVFTASGPGTGTDSGADPRSAPAPAFVAAAAAAPGFRPLPDAAGADPDRTAHAPHTAYGLRSGPLRSAPAAHTGRADHAGHVHHAARAPRADAPCTAVCTTQAGTRQEHHGARPAPPGHLVTTGDATAVAPPAPARTPPARAPTHSSSLSRPVPDRDRAPPAPSGA